LGIVRRQYMNYIWAGLLAVGILAGIINGRVGEVTKAAFDSAGKAVELGLGLLGVMCLWSGLMKIMEKSGMTDLIAKAAQPVLRPLFPELGRNDKAMGAIVMNLSANFMGLGNAATPFGIKAMEELQKANGKKDTATDAMCMFLVLNTSALQLIPSTVIALRSDAGSEAPAEIIPCIWAASICAAFAGIVAATILKRVWGSRSSAAVITGAPSALNAVKPMPDKPVVHGRPGTAGYGTAMRNRLYRVDISGTGTESGPGIEKGSGLNTRKVYDRRGDICGNGGRDCSGLKAERKAGTG